MAANMTARDAEWKRKNKVSGLEDAPLTQYGAQPPKAGASAQLDAVVGQGPTTGDSVANARYMGKTLRRDHGVVFQQWQAEKDPARRAQLQQQMMGLRSQFMEADRTANYAMAQPVARPVVQSPEQVQKERANLQSQADTINRERIAQPQPDYNLQAGYAAMPRELRNQAPLSADAAIRLDQTARYAAGEPVYERGKGVTTRGDQLRMESERAGGAPKPIDFGPQEDEATRQRNSDLAYGQYRERFDREKADALAAMETDRARGRLAREEEYAPQVLSGVTSKDAIAEAERTAERNTATAGPRQGADVETENARLAQAQLNAATANAKKSGPGRIDAVQDAKDRRDIAVAKFEGDQATDAGSAFAPPPAGGAMTPAQQQRENARVIAGAETNAQLQKASLQSPTYQAVDQKITAIGAQLAASVSATEIPTDQAIASAQELETRLSEIAAALPSLDEFQRNDVQAKIDAIFTPGSNMALTPGSHQLFNIVKNTTGLPILLGLVNRITGHKDRPTRLMDNRRGAQQEVERIRSYRPSK